MQETIRPAYILDTHALIWYLTQDKKLGPRAQAVFAAAEQGQTQIIVPAIVMAELWYANAKWNLFGDFGALYRDLQTKPYLQFASFTADDVLSFGIVQSVPEMHDRIIAGLALRLGIPLITADPLITAATLIEVVW